MQEYIICGKGRIVKLVPQRSRASREHESFLRHEYSGLFLVLAHL